MRYIEAEFTNGLGQSIKRYEVFDDNMSDIDISVNQYLVEAYDCYCDESMPPVLTEEEIDDYYNNCFWDWCELDEEEWEALAYNTFCYMYKFDNGVYVKYFRDEYDAAWHYVYNLDSVEYNYRLECFTNDNYTAWDIINCVPSITSLRQEYLTYIAENIADDVFGYYIRLGD